MRRQRFTLALLAAALPATLAADVAIRYATTMSTPSTPSNNKTGFRTIYMKGNMGVMVDEEQTTIVDFARQRVTVVDPKAKTFASVPTAEYKAYFAAKKQSEVETPEQAEIRKSMKVTCEKSTPGAVEIIQGVRAQEYDVTCITTTPVPESAKQFMSDIQIRLVRRLWLAETGERLRVPGLWQLSGFESWQEFLTTPAPGAASQGDRTLEEALRKGQSATLRERSEMSMKLAGSMAPDGYTPTFGTSEEMVSLSTEVLDDALFRAPADFREEPLEVFMKAVSAEADAETASLENNAAMKLAIPENINAFIPRLVPLTSTEPEAPAGPDGNKLQGEVELLVTVGPKGNVEDAEVLTGPAGLRQAAIDAMKQFTFRPVLRAGVPVTAYTQADITFIDFSKGPPETPPFQFTPEMEAAEVRLEQLGKAFPRTPEEVFADIEQDSGGGNKSRRYSRLPELALRAVRLGADDKAKAYATELLGEGLTGGYAWDRGNAIHDGHIVLGLLAIHSDDVTTAGQELLEAGKTPGSPMFNSFGPNMTLANELLKKGDRDAVLQYFELCRKFWKTGAKQLDSWSATVREGKIPAFGPALR